MVDLCIAGVVVVAVGLIAFAVFGGWFMCIPERRE